MLANLDLCRVTDELSGSATSSNDILQGVDKLTHCLHGENINHMGLYAIKKLCNLTTIINSRGVRIDSIRNKGFLSAVDITCRVG